MVKVLIVRVSKQRTLVTEDTNPGMHIHTPVEKSLDGLYFKILTCNVAWQFSVTFESNLSFKIFELV